MSDKSGGSPHSTKRPSPGTSEIKEERKSAEEVKPKYVPQTLTIQEVSMMANEKVCR